MTITENRETFFARLDPFFAPSVLLDVQLAYTLAKFGHRSQVRKELNDIGDPIRYFEHVRRTALIMVDEARIIRPELVISGLLHDVVEDAPNLPPPMLEKCFGHDVVCIVKTVSKVPKLGYLERFNMSTDWRPFFVKACDRLDNLRSMSAPTVTREFRQKQVKETQEHYLPLFKRGISLTPVAFVPKMEDTVQLVMDELSRQKTLLEVK